MKARLALMIGLVVGSNAVLAQNITERQTYELRGIRLGLPLEEFKKLPAPSNANGETNSNSKVFCASDAPEPGVDVNTETKGLKGLGLNFEWCYFYTRVASKQGKQLWKKASIVVAGIDVVPRFIFEREPTNVMRLYHMIMWSDSKFFNNCLEGLSKKYGKPTDLAERAIRSDFGLFEVPTAARWSSSQGSITIRENGSASVLEYIHPDWHLRVREREKANSPRPQDSL